MHQWSDTGIVLTVSRYGEESAVVRLLTEEHGVFPGMVKGAFGKKGRGIYQPGNLVHVEWKARLEEHLGHWRGELITPHAAELMTNPLALAMTNAMGSLVMACVPERIQEKEIFSILKDILHNIHLLDKDNVSLFSLYVQFEMTLLQALGFGLDLSECAATGVVDDLIYVSPKSGRAVCREAGEPYREKMLPLPDFLKGMDDAAASMPQVLDGLRLTGYFLEGSVLHPEGKSMPQARNDLLQMIAKF